MKKLSYIKIYFVLTCIAVVLLSIFIAHITAGRFSATDLAGKAYRSALFVKYSVKALGIPTLEASLATQEQAIPVIVYHGLGDGGEQTDFLIEIFEDQMFALKKEGYNTITTAELYLFLRGQKELPSNPILITFDDGRADNLAADPILQALDYKATMFVIGAYTNDNKQHGNYYLTEQQIQSMQKSGRWDIQAHSYEGHGTYDLPIVDRTVHFFGSRLWDPNYGRLETSLEFKTRIEEDMNKVKTKLQDTLKTQVNSFAFPFGDFGQNNEDDPELRNTTLETTAKIYDMAFIQQQPGRRFSTVYFDPQKQDDDLFLLKRIIVNNAWTGKELIAVLDKSKLKELPYMDDFSTDQGWISQWGESTVSLHDLHLRAKLKERGADTVLDGSQLWTDYKVTASLESVNQTGVYMLMRYKDDSNYAGCNFSNGFIFAEEIIDGNKNVSNGIRSADIQIPEGEFTVEGSVTGRTLACTFNGFTAKTEFLDPALNTGGLGFKVWDQTIGASDVHIRGINVTGL